MITSQNQAMQPTFLPSIITSTTVHRQCGRLELFSYLMKMVMSTACGLVSEQLQAWHGFKSRMYQIISDQLNGTVPVTAPENCP